MAEYKPLMIQNSQTFKEILQRMIEEGFLPTNEQALLLEYVDQDHFPFSILPIIARCRKEGRLEGVASLRELMETSKLDLASFGFSPPPSTVDQVCSLPPLSKDRDSFL